MAYKWIAKEIESLDPYVDYERIWALTATYYVDDFFMNYLYSIGVAYFQLPPWGGETLSRKGKGKMHTAPDKREQDTNNHFWTWFEFGPSSAATRKSIEHVNKIHAAMEKQMPGNYAHDDDFVYTISWVAADMHRLRERIGLPGYTKNQKIAAHLFWRDIAKLMVSANGPILEFPDSFDEMLEFLAKYEATDWEHSPEGRDICLALSDQFSNRWFPRGLRWVGHKMLLAMWGEPVHRVHRLPYTHPVTQKVFEFGIRTMIVMKEKVLPDPKLSTPEKKRLAAAAKKTPELAMT